MAEVRGLLRGNRLVTLTGAGGSGKTRLAIQVAGEFGDDVGYVDLAPITDQDLVPVAVSRALGLPDQPGRSTMGTVVRFIGDRSLLMVLDNCEHLLESTADLILARRDLAIPPPNLVDNGGVVDNATLPQGLSGRVASRHDAREGGVGRRVACVRVGLVMRS